MDINRFLPLLVPAIFFVLSEASLAWPRPRIISAAAFLIFSMLIFSVGRIIKAVPGQKGSWNFLALPVYYYLGQAVFILLLPDRRLIHLLIAVYAVFLYFYLLAVYCYLLKKRSYKKYSFENLSSFGNLLAVFFISSSAYGLQAFIGAPAWLLTLAAVSSYGFIAHQMFWANRINLRVSGFYILLICLILAELAWAISFLPLSYYVLGLILSLCYYMLTGLIRYYLVGGLDGRTVKRYLALGFLSIILVMLTARWM